jgi:hypothetical protein
MSNIRTAKLRGKTMNKRIRQITIFMALISMLFLTIGCDEKVKEQQANELSDAQVEDIVRRSYQYVALYNVNNKFALSQGGWNTIVPDTELKDHTMQDIARPNNDTLYIGAMLDLRNEPIILDIPAFDSQYVSLMVTAYDHYVNVPMTTRQADFSKPEKVLFYTARTEGYLGEPVEGVDRLFEASGDFISAVFRVMPHSNEPERFKRIIEQMQSVGLITLSEYQGKPARTVDVIAFPDVGATDAAVFGGNLLEVMQFIFNHVTFDPDNDLDQALLAAYEPLGVAPGKVFDPSITASFDSDRFRAASEKVSAESLALLQDPANTARLAPLQFQPKGKTDLDSLVAVSVIGPIGLPMEEAMYPAIVTSDGKPMNALNDYVIRMSADGLPPANAFWSATLYDTANGFFIPNDHKKYSIGENAGMKLNADGGIEIYVASEKPEGVPEENWLPINRKDENLDVILRLYVPDLEKMKSWTVPKAEKVGT